MIYVVEVPHEGQPHAWFAFHGEDLLSKVVLNDALQPWEVYDASSARELIELLGQTPGTAQAQSAFPGLCRLAEAYG